MIAQVRYSVAERLGGRVTLCEVCTVHEETRSASFLVEPQNKGRRFSSVWPQNR
jgi:copper oxidase (laccase) domain-containing protein